MIIDGGSAGQLHLLSVAQHDIYTPASLDPTRFHDS